jgi:hypothetical protein
MDKRLRKLKKVLSGVVETIARECEPVNDQNAKKWQMERKYDMSILENIYILGCGDWRDAHRLGEMG